MTPQLRSGRVLLGGLPWLARMTDKVKGINNRSISGYSFPCQMDQELLDHLGLAADTFAQSVESIVTRTENDSREAVDRAMLALLGRSGDPEEFVSAPRDKLFSSVFLVRNSRLLNQLEAEESPQHQ